MVDFDYSKLRQAWEATCRDRPRAAEQIGPPNWLVKERVRKDENFLMAVERVKREDLRAYRERRNG